MRSHAEATPCPAAVPPTQPRRVSFAQNLRLNTTNTVDDTENVDFTTEIRAQLRNAKPRRRASVMGRGSMFNPSMDIWQDVGREEQGSEATRANEGRPGAGARRTSILGKPAMRAPVLARKGPALADQRPEQAQETYRGSLMAQPARPRRVSGIMQDQTGSFSMPGAAEMRHQSRRTSIMGGAHLPVVEEPDRPHPLARSEQPRTQHWKEARRRTMWVPSDDTTVATIHPGAQLYVPDDTWRRPKAPDTGLDLVTVAEEEPENVTAIQQQRRRPRMSLAEKPRKAPLQLSRHQGGPNATILEDAVGEGGGKENIPPGLDNVVNLDVKAGPADIVIHFDDAKGWTDQATNFRRQSVRPMVPAKASHQAVMRQPKPPQDKQNIGMKRAGSSSLLHTSPAAKSSKSQHRGAPVARPQCNVKTWTSSAADWQKDSRYNQPDVVTCNIDVHGALQPRNSLRAKSYQAPVIADDLARPELYEEHWLSHQEIAITQLLNHLLSQSQPESNLRPEHTTMRRRMLRLHQDADTVALTKRLQASLQYGALAIPTDLLPKVARLETDLGMRREFLDLWLDTYDGDVLKAALETVVGRELVLPKRLSGASQTLTDEALRDRLLKKGIERYIQAFLVSHEDADPPKAPSSSIGSIARHMESSGIRQGEGGQAWKWRRTMMRSLMLILLLDRAKAAKVFTPCLFRKASKYKSSTLVLHALASRLVPSAGDISRVLTHLHYRLQMVQYPLEEHEYSVENIAVDLRDGILLARIVELLHFRAKLAPAQPAVTMTVALPTGEILESLLNDEATNGWLLSQHLKLPCIGRAQKLHNVQISLSAMAGLNGAAAHIASNITAEDIVDGHREKTMSLLWGLVCQSELGLLVDEAGLKRELRRLESDSDDATAGEEVEPEKRSTREHLLQRWAAAVGRSHGVTITNLTTSFADGGALEAIVTEYIDHVPTTTSSRASQPPSRQSGGSSGRPALADKLRTVGCSSSFVALFASSNHHHHSHHSHGATATYPFSRSFTLLTLSYLAARLLPLTTTHRACLILQRWYRAQVARRTASRRVQLMRLAHDCATVVNTRNRVIEAAVIIQGAWRRVLLRRLGELEGHVTALQAMVRGWRCRRRVSRQVRRDESSVRVRGGW